MKKKDIAPTIFLIVCIVVIAGLTVIQRTTGLEAFFKGNSGEQSAQEERRPAQSAVTVSNIEVKILEPESFTRAVNINGELKINTTSRQITSTLSGTLTDIYVKRGDTVSEGSAIAQVDPSTPGAKYKAADITTPLAGTVLSVNAYKGQTINTATPVITVGNPDRIILVLNIPEKYLSVLEIGTQAAFTTAAWPDTFYHAEVSYINSQVDTSTRTVETEFTITDADARLKAGMFVRTRLITEQQDNVLTVPSTCISTYLGDSIVYVVRDGKAVRVPVVTGSSNDSATVVVSGLTAGDMVVVNGSVTDGVAVNILNM